MVNQRLGVAGDRNFLLYVSGNTVSWLGAWVLRTAIGWLSWELTESPTWVGMVALSQYLPVILGAPLFGVLIDRVDRKKYAVVVQGVYTLLGVGLCILQFSGVLNIWLLFFYGFLIGVASAAYQPARLALVYDIAPPNMLTQAIGVNSILFNTSRLFGPALGGVIIAFYGVGFAFVINVFTHLLTLIAYLMVVVRPVEHQPKKGGIAQQFSEGLRYVLNHERIRELMFLSIVISVLARGVLDLLPAYAGGVYNAGSNGLATMMAAAGFGAVAAGFVLSAVKDDARLTQLVRIGVIGIGAGVVAFGLTGYYPLAIVLVALLGVLTTWGSIGMQAILQAKMDSAYRGRVMSLWGMSSVAGPALGAALLGTIGDLVGLPLITILSGALCVLICGVSVGKSKYLKPGAKLVEGQED